MTQILLEVLRKSPRVFNTKSLFSHLGYGHNRYDEYREALQQLMSQGRVVRLKGGRLQAKEEPKITSGKLRLTKHGYGFVDRVDGSIFINAREARKAFDGDLITVSLHDSGHSEGPSGQILKVDPESRLPLLARLRRRGGEWLADVKTGGLFFTARLTDVQGENKSKPGDWALVRFSGTRKRDSLPSCQLVEKLGNPHRKGVAERGMLLSAGFDLNYPREAEKEAEDLKVVPERKGVRRDLTDEFVITIDPQDAKDHDDAVSLRRDASGNYVLSVHIADVSRFVREDSLIDREARRRGFSLYLEHHYLPMLPPQLPGGRCSLKPGAKRLALSALITIAPDGRVIRRSITPSYIRVKRLFSYRQAQELIEGKDRNDAEAGKQLRNMWELARLLQQQRLADGGLDFDLPEAGFAWESGAAPRAIYRQPRLDSHRLIEEFMLAANRAVAEIWAERLGKNAPGIFRVHEPPDAEKRQKLCDYLADAGFEWSPEGLSDAKQLAKMLEEAKKRFPQEVIGNIVRKALMLARYDIKPRGHFGLGFKRYLHFTSPIRRYADLTVHRLIWKYLIEGTPKEQLTSLAETLQGLCQHLSERERRIAELEREAAKLAGLSYLDAHRDETFTAVLVDALQDKLFVALRDLYLEGMFAEDSPVQFLSRRETKKRRPSKSSVALIAIGDSLSVRIADIDLMNRKLEVYPV
jgi:ribonuclease R